MEHPEEILPLNFGTPCTPINRKMWPNRPGGLYWTITATFFTFFAAKSKYVYSTEYC